ncbi:MAG: hypothetical protein H7251_11060 [Acetobacteraceae bacterium]|nr:hypothetical protein [Acetobacteraceae bacterium]
MRALRARGDDVRVRPMTLPPGRGWLVREVGWEATGYMAQLEALLAEVTSRASLASAPAAGRLLRPICRMLGVSAGAAPVGLRASPEIVVGLREELAMVGESAGFAKIA